jgi:hypothetical protein
VVCECLYRNSQSKALLDELANRDQAVELACCTALYTTKWFTDVVHGAHDKMGCRHANTSFLCKVKHFYVTPIAIFVEIVVVVINI